MRVDTIFFSISQNLYYNKNYFKQIAFVQPQKERTMKNFLSLFCLLCICFFMSPTPFALAQDPTVIVENAYQDLLGRRADQDGLRFYRSKIIDEGWSAKQIRDAIRQSKEYNQVQADQIVSRAYEDILNRKPDKAGLEFYRNHIINDKWTEKQVRDSLRQSQEYLNKHK